MSSQARSSERRWAAQAWWESPNKRRRGCRSGRVAKARADERQWGASATSSWGGVEDQCAARRQWGASSEAESGWVAGSSWATASSSGGAAGQSAPQQRSWSWQPDQDKQRWAKTVEGEEALQRNRRGSNLVASPLSAASEPIIQPPDDDETDEEMPELVALSALADRNREQERSLLDLLSGQAFAASTFSALR